MSGGGRALAGLLVLALCSGCAMTDPYERDGLWQPDGAVQGNIAAMVADPRDLIRGQGPASDAEYGGGSAVGNLWSGHSKPLLTKTDTAASGSGGTPAGGSSGDLSSAGSN